jgi:tRNA pseudouridine13 synthase
LDISRAEPGDNWADTAQDGLGLKTIHGARESQDTGAVPLFQLVGSSYRNYAGRFDSCTEEILAEEGISARQFYSRDLQEVSTEGGFRRPSIAMREPSFDQGADATVLSFTLARGQYATVFVREIVKPSDPARQGFA